MRVRKRERPCRTTCQPINAPAAAIASSQRIECDAAALPFAAPAAEGDKDHEELAQLRAQMAEMQRKLDALSK